MALIQSVEIELDSHTEEFMSHFLKSLKLLHIASEKLENNDRLTALVALIKSAYYVNSCLSIDWELLQLHWHFKAASFPPPMTDSEFSSLQFSFLVMR